MIQRLTLALLLVVVGMLGWAFWRWSPTPSLDEIVGALRSDKVELTIQNTWRNEVQTMTSTWNDAHHTSHSVTTTRNPEETDSAFALRHRMAVTALQALYPPV